MVQRGQRDKVNGLIKAIQAIQAILAELARDCRFNGTPERDGFRRLGPVPPRLWCWRGGAGRRARRSAVRPVARDLRCQRTSGDHFGAPEGKDEG